MGEVVGFLGWESGGGKIFVLAGKLCFVRRMLHTSLEDLRARNSVGLLILQRQQGRDV